MPIVEKLVYEKMYSNEPFVRGDAKYAIFGEVMTKIFRIENGLTPTETVGVTIDKVTIDLKEVKLIESTGQLLLSGFVVDGQQKGGIFLCVLPLSPLSLTFSVLQRADSTIPRQKIGFSIQDQATVPSQSSFQ